MDVKQVRCDSGLMGWQCRLRRNYGDSFESWKRYCSVYNLHLKLGYRTPKEAWEENPLIQGSTNPSDFRKS